MRPRPRAVAEDPEVPADWPRPADVPPIAPDA
jgi:hypothetical protein